MKRILEPELMEEEKQGAAYARANFSEPNRQFIDLFSEKFPDFSGSVQRRTFSVVDLGCGPADILIRFAHRFPASRCLGIDGAAAMLKPGEEAVRRAGLEKRVQLLVRCLPCTGIPGLPFEVILSNSLLHHLHQPQVLWQALGKLGAPGCRILIMDLLRPQSTQDARRIVETYSGTESDILKADFFNSLLAAFRVDEVRDQLQTADLPLFCKQVSDRHLAVFGRL